MEISKKKMEISLQKHGFFQVLVLKIDNYLEISIFKHGNFQLLCRKSWKFVGNFHEIDKFQESKDGSFLEISKNLTSSENQNLEF